MTTAYFDSSLASGAKPYRKHWWQFWREKEPVMFMRPKPANDVVGIPPWKRSGGTAGLAALPGTPVPPEPKFGLYVEKPPPAPKMDALTELKRQLRSCTYGEFMTFVAAAAGEPQDPYDKITKNTWEWATA